MSKRVKFSFDSINKGKITPIKAEDLAMSSQRIKEEMKLVVRKYKKNETGSVMDARRLVVVHWHRPLLR
ncbi:hypothetical protein SAMN05443550_1271 [Pedobacter hartonius]|uniref:Uncharacterized protein n=1 Tax=Pedobacter hartonius TaxID=425514 RepID=A0A1H4HJU9_9SPHI|nr:hypothetical protein SAMN05443550_1271 [Pedobacter hartonius]